MTIRTAPTSWLPSSLAALTTWLTLLAWTSFAERPDRFMVPLVAGCAMVAVVGMGLRAIRTPAALVALGQLVLVLLWLQDRFAPGTALLGVLPTSSSVAGFTDALHRSTLAAQTYAAPVPASVTQFAPLLILTGALTAVAVDLLAVGLRRPPLAGLPLLAVYTAPVSILDGGVPWWKFAAAALGFLFLITADQDQRIGAWGRLLTPGAGVVESHDRVSGRPGLWSGARLLGSTVTAAAVVVPVFVPTFHATLFSGGPGGGHGHGDAVSVANPMVDLKRDLVRGADVDLVTLRTDDPDPSYLRISVLDAFDGKAWRPATRHIPTSQRAHGQLAAPPPGLQSGVTTTLHSATVSVSNDFKSRWLPTPYPVTSLSAPGDWRYDKTTLDFISAADDQTAAGVRYRLRSLTVTPTADQLAQPLPAPASIRAADTRLPQGFPGYVRRLARSVTAGKDEHFEQAVALQDWFREDGGFRYSLERSAGNGTDDLVRFLRPGPDGRVGYCEQFAAAMAVMGRSLGIPSRVAVGFLAPDRVSPRTYVFSSHDLHAWPEMYFGGTGWVRFEPTPQTRASDVPGYTTAPVTRSQPTASSSAPAAAPTSARAKPLQHEPDNLTSTGSRTTQQHSPVLPVVLAVVVLALLALTPRLLRTLGRRRRWSAARAAGAVAWVEAGWAELRDTALDLRLGWPPSSSPRVTAARVGAWFGDAGDTDQAQPGRPRARRGAGADPVAAASLQRLVSLLERARYARSLPEDATSLDEVRADVDRCVAALAAGATRARRWQAGWLPLSVLRLREGAVRERVRRRAPVLSGPGVDRPV